MPVRAGNTTSKNCLAWIVGGVWIGVIATVGVLVLAALTGFVDWQAAPPPIVPTAPAPALPTTSPQAPASPSQPATPVPSPTSTRPRPQSLIEPTHTPIVPVTPTPTHFITPAPFFEGPLVIGHSVEGRPLEAYRFGDGPVVRLMVFGIHGGYEWNTVALAGELIAHLQAHPDLIPDQNTLYILRNLNPDGYAREHGLDGRVNANGVDLNRNFPVNWASDWTRQFCWNYRPTTAGAAPGSEPESQGLMNFVLAVRPTALISYHSAALGIFPGGSRADPEIPDPASARLAEALAGVSDYPYPPIDIGCHYTGTLPDWATANRIPAVDLELTNHRDTDFETNLRILDVFLNWRR